MRAERVFGAIGLGLFFLFPLVSLLQLGDADDAWRAVAGRAGESVLVLTQGDGVDAVGSAVVLQAKPPRAVMAGTPPVARLKSATAAGTMTWTTRWADPSGRFTILEGDNPVTATASTAPPAPAGQNLSGLVPLTPAALQDVESNARGADHVTAVLATPARLAGQSLWIGELHATREPDGDAVYRGLKLRTLRDPEAASATVEAPRPGAIDPVLCGAPFVTREGVVVALYLGMDGGESTAVPMALVRDAVAALDRSFAP